jgi:hypothetical protein
MVTGTISWSPVAELAMVTVPLYVPGGSEPGLAVTVRVPGEAAEAVPVEGETCSHDPPDTVASDAVKLTLAPAFETLSCWLAGPLPAVNAKARDFVLSDSLEGCDAPTVKVTEMVRVVGEATGLASVTVPL